MKCQMNFTTSPDDVIRFTSAEDLRGFYQEHGCDGLEVMPLPYAATETAEVYQDARACPLLRPDMVTGVHCCCIQDWMGRPRKELIDHYRKDLEYAVQMGAEYVVFHVTQVDGEESFTYRTKHTDREVIKAAASLINELLDGGGYSFWFLMENLWWPGLTFCDAEEARELIGSVQYEKKGFMLDTGHYLHTNLDLRSEDEAVEYLHRMLDRQSDLIPCIKGVHLQQSLTGAYVKQWLAEAHELPRDPKEQFRMVYEHVFQLDRHEPFTAKGVKKLVERIHPQYVTYEYITRNRAELAQYLEQGRLERVGKF